MLRTSALKSSVRATKSVSQLTSTSTPTPPPGWMYASTRPWLAARSAFEAALAAPRLRSVSMASSMSPLLSASAFLHSIMPTPVRWRSSMTCLGEISANMNSLPSTAAPGGLRWGSSSPRALVRRGGCDLGSGGLGRLRDGVAAVGHGLAGRLDRLGLGSLGLLRRGHALALDHGVGDHAAEQADGPDRVGVARGRRLDHLGVAVRVGDADDRDAQPVGLGDRDLFLLGVDDEDQAGKRVHLLDAGERVLELRSLAAQARLLLLRQAVHDALVRHAVELLEPLDAALHRLEVGQHPAEPALDDVELAAAQRLLGDHALGLALGADEQDVAALLDRARDRVPGLVQALERLLQVDDVDAVPFDEDVLL